MTDANLNSGGKEPGKVIFPAPPCKYCGTTDIVHYWAGQGGCPGAYGANPQPEPPQGELEGILSFVEGHYPSDLFPPVTSEELAELNKTMPNIVTRLHCDGIRHAIGMVRKQALAHPNTTGDK